MRLQSEDIRRAARQAVTYTVLVVAITAFLIMLRVWGVGGIEETGALPMPPDSLSTPKSVANPAVRPVAAPRPRPAPATPDATDRQGPGTNEDSTRPGRPGARRVALASERHATPLLRDL